MKYRLFNTETPTDTYVSYRLVDDKGQTIKTYENHACFSSVTYAAIPPDARYIVVYRSLSKVPYAHPVIQHWIKEISLLGFPCSVRRTGRGKDSVIEVAIDLKDYALKMHVSATLQLIRCLWETGCALVPDIYFRMLKDRRLGLDVRFDLLQDAHKEVRDKKHEEASGGYANTNHQVTYKGNGSNVGREVLFKRLKATAHSVYSGEYSTLDSLWNGDLVDEKT